MKEKYIALMEKTLSAYTDEHILRYFNDVKTNGLTEHGFPRLTATIGILLSHGRRKDLWPLFLEMMDFCCKTIPVVRAANDFSVREIICCLLEVEKSGMVSKEKTERWRADLATIDAMTCYNKFATSLTDPVRNWALFTAVSEYFRFDAGIGGEMEFIELQIGQQLQWFDENGMYQDKKGSDVNHPILYDLVARELFSLLLSRGYRGRYYTQIDEALKKAALLTLDMQSTNGEMAFGGRSNQFLHNEVTMIAVLEYEARRYAREGNAALASRFKAASARALAVTEKWLDQQPIYHIKNRFPPETRFGCEKYAYFDKYMITVASGLWIVYLICDDTIPSEEMPEHTSRVAQTSYHFHKLFLKCGEYAMEYDTNGDPEYDAGGLGRVHRKGAPSAICLSCPCPAAPKYTVDIEKPFAFSLCSAIREEDGWRFGAEKRVQHQVINTSTDHDSASATVLCEFENDRAVKEHYTVTENGVAITVEGDGEIGYALPAFCFDGAVSPQITAAEHTLTVSYEGWMCRYTTNGRIMDLNRTAANRNGHYRGYIAISQNTLNVKIELEKTV